MKKNVWSLDPNEIAIISGERYTFRRDFYSKRPRLGRVLVRELVNINDHKDKKRFIRGIEVEVER